MEDIDSAVDALSERRVRFERHEVMTQDKNGISRAGPDIAWFKDPAGNILAVIQGP